MGVDEVELIELWNADREKAYELFAAFPEDDNGFENIAYGMDREEFDALVERKRLASEGIGLPEGFVPDTVYLLSDGGNYVGIFNFRHELNDFLKNGPGHIGYGIAPGWRMKGYATRGLDLLIDKVSPLIREDEIYLSVNKDNPASLSTQLRAGGRIHHEDDSKYYVRIGKR